MKITLLDYTENGMNKIARMARATRLNSYENGFELDETKDDKFVKRLIRVGHLGILEHISFTFHISEVSRCLTHQLVRHRIASYLQMSNRHAKPEFRGYVTPISINTIEYKEFMDNAYLLYRDMIADGLPIEDARYVLPPAFFTHISVTMNCRELLHFFELRCDKAAQWEIRGMALEMLKICYEKYPVIFKDIYDKYKKDIK